jgi:hypothetical protein
MMMMMMIINILTFMAMDGQPNSHQ